MDSTLKKRKGRGRAVETIALTDASIRILREIQPCSVRAVCSRLFIEKLIPDMGKNSTGKVSTQLRYARENGLLDWDWIVDETREAETVASWNSPDEIISAAVNQYRKDYWAIQPRRVEVWCEKGTVRGTVTPVLKKYGVTFRVLHGYGSATSIHGIAAETMRSEKPMTVFYIGDHDPSGRHMSDVDLPTRLARYGGRATIIRLALDDRDVGVDSPFPWFPVGYKIGDARYQGFVDRFGQRCWEVDALPPPTLRERLDKAIAGVLDMDAWKHAVRIESAETESMKSIMGHFKASILGLGSKCSEGGAHG